MPRKYASTLAVIDMIAAERIRQMEAEGFSQAHDDQYRHGELARAAGCYALNVGKATAHETQHAIQLSRAQFAASPMPADWPWAGDWWKPYTPLQDLVRAAALIVADIERLLRQRTHPSFRQMPQLPPPPSADEVAALIGGTAFASPSDNSFMQPIPEAYTADRRFAQTSEARAIIEGAPSDLRASLAEACAKAGFACRFMPERLYGSKHIWLTLAGPPNVNLSAGMDAIEAQTGLKLLGRHPIKDMTDPALCAGVSHGAGITSAAYDAAEVN